MLLMKSQKALKSEEKLQQALTRSEKSRGYCKKRFKNLAKKVAKINKENSRRTQKNNSFSGYSQMYQARIKTQLKEQCSSTLAFLIATKRKIFHS